MKKVIYIKEESEKKTKWIKELLSRYDVEIYPKLIEGNLKSLYADVQSCCLQITCFHQQIYVKIYDAFGNDFYTYFGENDINAQKKLQHFIQKTCSLSVRCEELVIRQAKQSDIQELEEMYQKRVAYNDRHEISQWKPWEVTWEELSKLYDIQDFYVGIVNDHIACGIAVVDEDALYWPDRKKGESLYLHKVCVHPDYRGKGYSDAMISFFKELGKGMGKEEVCLDVRKHKKALREMYERNGFELYCYGSFVPEFDTALYKYNYHHHDDIE